MYDGTLIVESLKVGTELEGVPFTVRKVGRYDVGNASTDQPKVWSVVEFEVERGEELAGLLSQVLDSPGWYADLHDDRETFVVFPRRVFRYPRGDEAARAEAQEFGRGLAIPEPQLDWTR
ncbi:hypothetical protein ACQPYH_37235 [Kribbella sp. CA-245084]|uniref:hypothetical protein n=1 Tax=Kribbella sp. CA-245084 TaxID=3239940 RepID=UPI003D91AA8F